MRLPVCMSMMDQWGGGGGVPYATACLYVHDGSVCVCVCGGSTMCDCLSVCP